MSIFLDLYIFNPSHIYIFNFYFNHLHRDLLSHVQVIYVFLAWTQIPGYPAGYQTLNTACLDTYVLCKKKAFFSRPTPRLSPTSFSLHIMSKSLIFTFLFLTSLRLVSAQFNIFEMFGQQHQQQHQQHQQEQHKSGHAYSDSGVSIRYRPCTS